MNHPISDTFPFARLRICLLLVVTLSVPLVGPGALANTCPQLFKDYVLEGTRAKSRPWYAPLASKLIGVFQRNTEKDFLPTLAQFTVAGFNANYKGRIGKGHPVFGWGKAAGNINADLGGNKPIEYRGLNPSVFGRFQTLGGPSYSTSFISRNKVAGKRLSFSVAESHTTQVAYTPISEYFQAAPIKHAYTQPANKLYVEFYQKIGESKEPPTREQMIEINQRLQATLKYLKLALTNEKGEIPMDRIFTSSSLEALGENRLVNVSGRDVVSFSLYREVYRSIYTQDKLTWSEAFVAVLHDVMLMSDSKFDVFESRLN